MWFRTRTELFPLQQLLLMIEQGELGLPDFQRSFVWDTSNVRALLATFLRGWPAGSLLFVEGSPMFAGSPRPFESAPALNEVEYLVLDGQQRLTALYQALYGRGDRHYYLHLPKKDMERVWLDVEELEERISAARAGDSPREIPGTIAVPFTFLRSPESYLSWAESQKGSLSTAALNDVYRRLVSGLTGYQFAAVVLGSDVEPEAVSRMFERVNATGLRLSAFDLVVARTFADPSSPQPWNLRSEFELALEQNPIIASFIDDDGLPLLEAISLHHAGDVRRSRVIRLPADVVRTNWPRATSAMAEALSLMTSTLGVLEPSWLPYRAFLVVLTSFLMDHQVEEHARLVERWFWSRAFGSRFDVGVNTSIQREYVELRNAATGEDVMSRLAGPSQADMMGATRSSGSQLFRAFLCAMVASGRRDPATLGELRGPSELSFDGASTFPLSGTFAGDMRPSARVRALSQLAASRRPEWLRGPDAIPNLIERLGGSTLQFIGPDASHADLQTFWASRISRLAAFLEERAIGELDASALQVRAQ